MTSKMYKVAMVDCSEELSPQVMVLDTGRVYGREEAMAIAEKLNSNNKEEIKALDYSHCVAYSVYSE